MTDPLQGKTAIITGGSTELAGTVALVLAKAGVNICLCGKQADLLELSANKIKEIGGEVITRVTDLDTLEETQAIVEQTKSAFGGLDIQIPRLAILERRDDPQPQRQNVGSGHECQLA